MISFRPGKMQILIQPDLRREQGAVLALCRSWTLAPAWGEHGSPREHLVAP